MPGVRQIPEAPLSLEHQGPAFDPSALGPSLFDIEPVVPTGPDDAQTCALPSYSDRAGGLMDGATTGTAEARLITDRHDLVVSRRHTRTRLRIAC